MKLFVLTSRIPYPLEKGDKLRIYHQIKELSKKNKIYLCALNLPFTKVHPDAMAVLSEYCEDIRFINLSLLNISTNLFKSVFTKTPFQSALFSDAKAKKQVNKYLESVKPDHIYCQLTRVADYVIDNKQKKTLDYMDAFSIGMERRKNKAKFIKKAFYNWEYKKQKTYEKRVFDAFNQHSIITEEDRNHIDHKKHKLIHIIPNGVDFNYFSPVDTKEEYDMVFVGNLSYPPNVDACIYLCKEILPIIQKKLPGVKVLLAGAKPSKKITALSSKCIHVSGWLDDIRLAYAKSKLFVAPMRMGTGLQNKLLEAMAMKKACVTSSLANKALKAPVNSIHIGDTAEEIAQKCIQLLEDKEERKELANNGNVFVKETYNWSKSTQLLEKLFIK